MSFLFKSKLSLYDVSQFAEKPGGEENEVSQMVKDIYINECSKINVQPHDMVTLKLKKGIQRSFRNESMQGSSIITKISNRGNGKERRVSFRKLGIADEQVQCICACLQHPNIPPQSQFNSIIFSKNKISDVGAKFISGLIQSCKSLSLVDLSNNNITSEGAVYIKLACIKRAVPLQVNLLGNQMNKEFAMTFIKSCLSIQMNCNNSPSSNNLTINQKNFDFLEHDETTTSSVISPTNMSSPTNTSPSPPHSRHFSISDAATQSTFEKQQITFTTTSAQADLKNTFGDDDNDFEVDFNKMSPEQPNTITQPTNRSPNKSPPIEKHDDDHCFDFNDDDRFGTALDFGKVDITKEKTQSAPIHNQDNDLNFDFEDVLNDSFRQQDVISDDDHAMDVTIVNGPPIYEHDFSEKCVGSTILQSLQNNDNLFQQITSLCLSHNQLSSIDYLPESVQYLDLSFNKIKILSGCFSFLKKLKFCNLRYNLIDDVYDSRLSECLELEQLDVSHNQLGDCFYISTCQSLKVLDLSFNNIKAKTSIRGLSLMIRLESLGIVGNPLTRRTSEHLRMFLLTLSPNLKYVDGKVLTKHNRNKGYVVAKAAMTPTKVEAITKHVNTPSSPPSSTVSSPRVQNKISSPRTPTYGRTSKALFVKSPEPPQSANNIPTPIKTKSSSPTKYTMSPGLIKLAYSKPNTPSPNIEPSKKVTKSTSIKALERLSIPKQVINNDHLVKPIKSTFTNKTATTNITNNIQEEKNDNATEESDTDTSISSVNLDTLVLPSMTAEEREKLNAKLDNIRSDFKATRAAYITLSGFKLDSINADEIIEFKHLIETCDLFVECEISNEFRDLLGPLLSNIDSLVVKTNKLKQKLKSMFKLFEDQCIQVLLKDDA
ncbi:hypothetical protein AKO1_009378 [Acrasis kona]|uniref:Leucine-rich repeat-containing protein n=1 Tax=Acrasis kona TaxID=1008807 RepID=A0AAW2ZKV1_9EUKA